jgi:hypothetical protein
VVLPDLRFDLAHIEDAQRRYDAILRLFSELTAIENKLNTIITTLLTFSELDACRGVIITIEANDTRLESITGLYRQYQAAMGTLARVDVTLAKSTDVQEAAAVLSDVEKRHARAEVLRALRQDYIYAEDKAINYERVKEQFTGLEDAAALLSRLTRDLDKLTALKNTKALYDIKDAVVLTTTGRINRAAIDLEAAKQEYTAAIEATGGVCPLLEIECDKLKGVK